MALPVELNSIFKNKQKSYKMALILTLLDELEKHNQRVVSLVNVKERFLNYYKEQEEVQPAWEQPPEKLAKMWKDLTSAQLNNIMDAPYQALSTILDIRPSENAIGFKESIWDQFLPQTLMELRQYALFEIEEYKKQQRKLVPLKDYLTRVLSEYLQAKRQPFGSHPLGVLMRRTIPEKLSSLSFLDDQFKVQGSVGQGTWADIPWIAIMDKRITDSTQRGEYLVYLFDEKMESVYLTFILGVTKPLQEKGKRVGYEYFSSKVKEIRALIPLDGFQKDDQIFLTTKGIGADYQAATVSYKKYNLDQMPDNELLIEDLRQLVENYKQYVSKTITTATPPMFRYTMAHIYYGQGIMKYLGKYPDKVIPLDELIRNYTEVLKSGAEAQHPKERIMHVGRALEDLGLLQQKDNGFQLTFIGERYTNHFGTDTWALSQKQIEILHTLIENANETNKELRRVLQSAALLAKELDTFTMEAFKQPFIQSMGDTGWGEVTQTDRTKFMLNWLQDLRYVEKIGDHYVFVKEPDEVSTLSPKEVMEHVKGYIRQRGFQYPDSLIENFYLSLKTKPFVILAGISGTGKTKLVKLFADAIGAGDREQFTLIPVRPDWSDPSDLLGYKDLNQTFRPGRLTEILLEAGRPENRGKPYFVCLDEMNLARVEHYFSDILSILETQSHRDGEIVTDAVLFKDVLGGEQDLTIPDNVYIVGTVNMDETTHPFSKKVLDRANTIEFNYIRLEDYPAPEVSNPILPLTVCNPFLRSDYLHLKDAFTEYGDLIKSTTEKLVAINEILEDIHSHVGFRVRDSICFYMVYNKRFELMADEDAFDIQLLQKILPRIQGSSLSVKRVLIELLQLCLKQRLNVDNLLNDPSELYEQWRKKDSIPPAHYPLSARKLAYMLRRLEEDGFTSFWLS